MILENIIDEVIIDAGRVFRVGPINGEVVTIIPIESILRGKPHKSFAVLQDRADMPLGKTFIGRKVNEFGVIALSTAGIHASPGN